MLMNTDRWNMFNFIHMAFKCFRYTIYIHHIQKTTVHKVFNECQCLWMARELMRPGVPAPRSSIKPFSPMSGSRGNAQLKNSVLDPFWRLTKMSDTGNHRLWASFGSKPSYSSGAPTFWTRIRSWSGHNQRLKHHFGRFQRWEISWSHSVHRW